MPQRIEGILFDLGDTLLDFGRMSATKLFKAGGRLAYDYLRRLGEPVPAFRKYLLSQLRAIRWRHALGHVFGREFDSLALMARISRRFGQRLDDEQLLELARLWYEPMSRCATVEEGVPEVLAELAGRGLKLGSVSNTFVPAAVMDMHLQREGLLDSLPVRVYSCQIGYRKPRRRIFAAALEQAGLDAGSTLFVGDSLRADIKGANRMGMVSVLRDIDGRHSRRRTGARHRIRSVLELPEIVAAMNGG